MIETFPEFLKYGIIGLGAILAILAYLLLTQEQKQSTPRTQILTATYVFMTFSIVLILLGIFADWTRSTEPQDSFSTEIPRGTAVPIGALNGSYNVDGTDIDFPSENFKTPRNHYKGEFQIVEQNGIMIMEGDLQTLDATNDTFKGVSRIKAHLTINNNYLSGYYSNINQRINGFGAAFLKFNDASNLGTGYFTFRPTSGDSKVGIAKITLSRK